MNKRNNFKSRTLAILLLIVFLISSGCQAQKPEENELVVRVGSQRAVFSAIPFVATEKGFFEEEGLNLEWNWFTGGPQLLEAMKGGSIDVALPAGASPGQIAVGNGSPLYFVSNLMWGGEVIVMRKDVFERVDLGNPDSLKGLTVAIVSKGSMQDYFVRQWLESVGLDPETDVKFREVAAGAAMRSAFLAQEIDIASSWEPHGTLLEKEELGVIVGTGEQLKPKHDNTGFLTTKSFYDDNRDTIIKILRALEKARVYAIEHPEELNEIVAKFFDIEPDVIASSFGNNILVIPDSLSPNEDFYYEAGEFLSEWGYTKTTPQVYLPDYLSVWEALQKEAGVLR